MEISTLDVILRLFLAAAVGALIGAERQWRSHAAGARTHALVASGAALFTLAGAYGFPEFERSGNVDPMRVAAQVASGIGFVGAGAILRQGLTVRGLTTAATLWSSAALGVAAGAGFFPGALAGFAAVFGALFALRYVRDATRRVRGLAELDDLEVDDIVLEVDYERGRGTLSYLISAIDDAGAEITGLSIKDDGDRGNPGIRHTALHVRAPSRMKLAAVTDGVTELPEVRSVRVGDRAPTAA